MISPHTYTPKQRLFIYLRQAGRSRETLAKMFNARFGTNLTASQIHGACKRWHLMSGLSGRFEKGSVPANKGTKGLTSGNRTSFKKGAKPKNYLPVGAETIVNGYIKIKIADPKTWRMKHVWIWESVYGPVPKGCVVIFKDRDHMNCEISNLALIKRSELAVLNKFGLILPDGRLTDAGINLGKLKSALYAKKKGKKR